MECLRTVEPRRRQRLRSGRRRRLDKEIGLLGEHRRHRPQARLGRRLPGCPFVYWPRRMRNSPSAISAPARRRSRSNPIPEKARNEFGLLDETSGAPPLLKLEPSTLASFVTVNSLHADSVPADSAQTRY